MSGALLRAFTANRVPDHIARRLGYDPDAVRKHHHRATELAKPNGGLKERKHMYWGGRHPKDYLLAHNPVQPGFVDQEHGRNGFRVMWIPPELTSRKEHPFRVCICGWRPDLGTHYSCGRPRRIIDIPPEEIEHWWD
jgi:hypothetical protein